MTSSQSSYVPSAAASKASDYFNSLPQEERRKLAPLLEHYRQMGLAEANHALRHAVHTIDARVRRIRDAA